MSILKPAFSFIFGVLTTFYAAWILVTLYGWYIIPWIETAPKLPYVIAIGIAFIARLITYNLTLIDVERMHDWLFNTPSEDKEELQIKANRMMWILKIWNLATMTAFLFAGWLYHFFV